MSRYTTNGVLTGLHYHKAGQYRSLERVTCVTLALLIVVVVACLIRPGDGGQRVDQTNHVGGIPRFRGGFSYPPPSSPPFVSGYLGQVRIVGNSPVLIEPASMLPASIFFDSRPGPGRFGSRVDFPAGDPPGPLSLDSDFGLPDPIPAWRFTVRGLPSGIIHEDIGLVRSPQAILANPPWPPGVGLVHDTAIVEGYLLFDADGWLSFEFLSETHPGLGFVAAVRSAVNESKCFPSRDNHGNRISVRCRYRCLFFHGGQSSVSVDGSITARLRAD